jgi:hypothetical protein
MNSEPQCTGGAAIDHPETGVCNHAATTPELARPPYTYTDAQNHRLALMATADFKDRPYVWVEAEDLAIGGDITSVWLTIEQAALLGDALAGAVSASFTDHTGDFLVTEPGELHTVVTVTRVRDEDDELGVVRVVLLTDRLPEVRAALAGTAERAQQRVTVQLEPATPEPTTPAPLLSANERAFLRFALELAGDAILDNPEDFTADDDAALASLRKLAGGEQA